MFLLISKVVKLALSLYHGNADVERGFSKSKLTLTKDKTRMDERTLNARLTKYDSTKKFKNEFHLLPVDQDLLSKGQKAHNSYKSYLEEEKIRKNEIEVASRREKVKIEEEKENLKKIKKINSDVKELEIHLKHLQKQKTELKKSSNELMENVNNQLQKVLKQNKRKEEETKEVGILKLAKEIDQKKQKFQIIY